MPCYDCVGGVLRRCLEYDNIDGSLRSVSAGYDVVDGTLKQYYSAPLTAGDIGYIEVEFTQAVLPSGYENKYSLSISSLTTNTSAKNARAASTHTSGGDFKSGDYSGCVWIHLADGLKVPANHPILKNSNLIASLTDTGSGTGNRAGKFCDIEMYQQSTRSYNMSSCSSNQFYLYVSISSGSSIYYQLAINSFKIGSTSIPFCFVNNIK